jgi:transposase InsO family protein
MMVYSYTMKYTPGEKMILADALSRAPLASSQHVTELVDSGIISELIDSLAISNSRLDRLKAALLEDTAGQWLVKYITEGWPQYKAVDSEVQHLFTFKEQLTHVRGVVFYMNRVFIPRLERGRVLTEIHKGHQGENKCIRRARDVVWWPGMTKDIREMVKTCASCLEHRRNPKEPLMGTAVPERAWWRLAMDFFEKDGHMYLVVVDYFSRYISVHEMGESATAEATVKVLNNLFCMLGIPNSIVSDNGPQFTSEKFKEFLNKWDVQHITSSPKYPQSNGEAERAVQTVKGLMTKNIGLASALCCYRDTPLANGYSPAQLLFGRGLNSMGYLNEQRIDLKRLHGFERNQRAKQEESYNRRHRVQERSPLRVGQNVVVRDPGRPAINGRIVASQGREVVVVGNTERLLRRNRHLVQISGETEPRETIEGEATLEVPGGVVPGVSGLVAPEIQTRGNILTGAPETQDNTQQEADDEAPQGGLVEREISSHTRLITTRSGRVSRKPDRLNL